MRNKHQSLLNDLLHCLSRDVQQAGGRLMFEKLEGSTWVIPVRTVREIGVVTVAVVVGGGAELVTSRGWILTMRAETSLA